MKWLKSGEEKLVNILLSSMAELTSQNTEKCQLGGFSR